MENPSASKCAAAGRSHNDRESVRNGIRMDGEWEHQRFCEEPSGCRPSRACKFSIRSLAVFDWLITAQFSSWEVSQEG